MKYVIIRDDDVNALTPVDWLEQLYGHVLRRGIRVCLSVIPNVSTQIYKTDGELEGFLPRCYDFTQENVRLDSRLPIVTHILDNPLYEVIQHGYTHQFQNGSSEFANLALPEAIERMQAGMDILIGAGFPKPETFVAPQDKLSRATLRAAAGRYRFVSGGWYQASWVPYLWLPQYLLEKKVKKNNNWSIGATTFLTHPGCLLSRFRPRENQLQAVKEYILKNRLSILVNHFWEYFPDGCADVEFIAQFHELAEFLSNCSEIQVVTFGQLDHVLS